MTHLRTNSSSQPLPRWLIEQRHFDTIANKHAQIRPTLNSLSQARFNGEALDEESAEYEARQEAMWFSRIKEESHVRP